ncbi:chromosome condensation [Fusarium beomiforme]|uniref:Chromosome condensation n=1 Tax=Fusarium beomiforme TaxID=44412 RepID=A0A9P5A6N1_9HYPO|nr:chromosome condensation [Fusarium beomiforme]
MNNSSSSTNTHNPPDKFGNEHIKSKEHQNQENNKSSFNKVATQGPVQKPQEAIFRRYPTSDHPPHSADRNTRPRHYSELNNQNFTNLVEEYDLDEVASIALIANPYSPVDDGNGLERARTREMKLRDEEFHIPENPDRPLPSKEVSHKALSFTSKLYTHSYLVFFSIMGTLAREGMTALLVYPGAPVIFPTLWVNFAGCLIMGFLAEDRMLFRHEWGQSTYDKHIKPSRQKEQDQENIETVSDDLASASKDEDPTAAKKAHLSIKKTIPLYIGLSVGFCGSFTTFSTFILDSFLALANELENPSAPTSERNKGFSFCALAAVVLMTVHVSLGGLFLGAHIAILAEPISPSLSYLFMGKVIDPLAVVLGWGCWAGAVIMCIFPPHDAWRGSVLFSIAFAPLGVFTRFYLAIYVNGKLPTFPLGTFAANVLGSLILAVVWDISYLSSMASIGEQLLDGVKNGYCAAVTTVSTLALDLSTLQRQHAYRYGTVSFLVSFGLMVIISGSVQWTRGN